jgi:hypothetical protein
MHTIAQRYCFIVSLLSHGLSIMQFNAVDYLRELLLYFL